MRYFVTGTGGPGFMSEQEMKDILTGVVMPTFAQLVKLERAKTIVAGGMPIGDRAFVFIAEARTNDDLDKMLRSLPVWGALEWTVTPLQSFAGRAAMERKALREMKKAK